MKEEINLITEQIRKGFSLLKYKKKINLLTGIVAFFFIIACTGTLIAIFLLNQSWKQTKQKISLVEGQIKSLEKDESYAVVVANRVAAINSILKSRQSFAETVSSIKLLFVPNFQLSSLEVAANAGWRIIGSCSDLQSLNKFYEIVEQLRLNPKFAKMSYPSVSKDIENGIYHLTLELRELK